MSKELRFNFELGVELHHTDVVLNTKASDIYKVARLKGNSYSAHECGYVTPLGTYFKCEPYGHLDMLAELLSFPDYKMLYDKWQEFLNSERCAFSWVGTSKGCYDDFFMIELEWAKIAAYGDGSNNNGLPMEEWSYDWRLERVYPLTEAQVSAIFPT